MIRETHQTTQLVANCRANAFPKGWTENKQVVREGRQSVIK